MATRQPATSNQPELEELVRHQESLRQVIESVSSELVLRPLLTNIVRHACELLGAERGTIGLVDEDREIVRTEAVFHMPNGELGAEIPKGVGLAGMVLETQEPVVMRYGDTSKPPIAEMAEDSVIGMPIFWRERMIGFFGIGATSPHHFSQRDVDTLALLARHAAIAITNAQLYESEKRRVARITTVGRVGQLITSSLSLEEILQTAVEAVSEQLNYSTVGLLLASEEDPETLVLHGFCRTGSNVAVGEYRQVIGEGIIGEAAARREAILVPDVRTHSSYIPIPGGSTLRSELAVPMIVGERVLGVLNIESEEPIHEDDVPGIEIVADQLGVAIDNARLFGETEHALDEMQLLYDTSHRMSMAMDIRGVIDAYLEQVAMRSSPYICSIGMYDYDEAGEPTVKVLGRWSPDEGLTHPKETYGHGPDGLDPLLQGGATVTVADVHTDPRAGEELRRLQREHGRPALAMMPLMVRGRRIGLVVLSYPKVHHWSEADLRPFQITAVQLAAMLHARRQQRRLAEHDQQLAILQERQHLARELHDSVSQLIFSMTLIAQSLGPAWRRGVPEGEKRAERLLELSQAARAEMRALLVELQPSETTDRAQRLLAGIEHVKHSGIEEALRKHIRGVSRDGLEVEFNVEDYIEQPLAEEETLFRIAQEALNNVVKHANARQVSVSLSATEERCRLSVEDDGCGFQHPESAGAPESTETSFGLKSMRDRAEARGGRFELTTSPGQGTKIEVHLDKHTPE